MNVLSLFDGMSCGQIALERAEIPVENYFASEIDKWAIKITQKNYPNTVQLGNVSQWQDWHLPKIDLLLGGSPCQGFSIAGKRLDWDDPRSMLFFKYVDCLKWYKPTWFIFENVARMKKEVQDAISLELGVEPVRINSSLVSAQNRDRLYWTNIPNIEQPEDKQIYLKDIIEYGYVDKMKSYCIDANYYKGGNPKRYFEKASRQLVFDVGILQRAKGNNLGGIRGYDGKSPSLSSSQWQDNNFLCAFENELRDKSKTVRVGGRNSPPGSKQEWDNIFKSPKDLPKNLKYRKLLPIECERLQTVPDNYTKEVSNSQRYKMLGNGWTVDVIVHILDHIK